MTVYRYSEDKLLACLKSKVSHLAKSSVNELSRTIVRELAKDGLMEDGNEQLLERECPHVLRNSLDLSFTHSRKDKICVRSAVAVSPS